MLRGAGVMCQVVCVCSLGATPRYLGRRTAEINKYTHARRVATAHVGRACRGQANSAATGKRSKQKIRPLGRGTHLVMVKTEACSGLWWMRDMNTFTCRRYLLTHTTGDALALTTPSLLHGTPRQVQLLDTPRPSLPYLLWW